MSNPYARQFFVNDGTDSNEHHVDQISDPRYLIPRVPELASQFAAIRSLQDRLWDLRQPGLGGPGSDRVGGIGGMKWIASIPKSVALAAELLEPNLFRDEQTFFAWLKRQKEKGFNYSTRKA